jgi:hypothetical protein
VVEVQFAHQRVVVGDLAGVVVLAHVDEGAEHETHPVQGLQEGVGLVVVERPACRQQPVDRVDRVEAGGDEVVVHQPLVLGLGLASSCR